MNTEQRARIAKNRLAARIRFLNKFDVLCFNNVPDFIINAFFSDGTYLERMIVTNFCFLNGIPFKKLTILIHGRFKREHLKKVERLYSDFVAGRYVNHYYSFCVARKVVSFLNGTIKRKQ